MSNPAISYSFPLKKITKIDMQKQRAMMDAEQFKEASWVVVNALKEKGYGSVLESQLPVADFKVIIQPIKGFSTRGNIKFRFCSG